MILRFFELLMERAGATKRDKIEYQLNGRKLRKGATLRKQGVREKREERQQAAMITTGGKEEEMM